MIHSKRYGISLRCMRAFQRNAKAPPLMNKKYMNDYTLIEGMTQNHYQWTTEKAITVVAPFPFKKEAGMYEVSALDHLDAKVDALFQKFDKLSVSTVTPSSIMPPCEICRVAGHIGVDCQLGVSVVSPEEVNYAQRNFSYPFRKQSTMTPPDFANNQRVSKKFNFKLFLENFVMF